MIVLNSPKGWTGPKIVDGQQVEGTFRSHQVPLSGLAQDPTHLAMLEALVALADWDALTAFLPRARTFTQALALFCGSRVVADRACFNTLFAQSFDQSNRAQGRAPSGTVEHMKNFLRLSGRLSQLRSALQNVPGPLVCPAPKLRQPCRL